MKWTTDTEYGTLDVTINLSKPEKDPKAIAAAKNAKQSAYPTVSYTHLDVYKRQTQNSADIDSEIKTAEDDLKFTMGL